MTVSIDHFVFPMSFAQQRLWFLEQINQRSASYTISGAVRLIGPLDCAALQQALDALVERHESLRTTFAFVDDAPAQIIADRLSIPLRVIPLEAADDWPGVVRRLAAAEVRQPFDLTRGPLLRVSLIRRTGADHVLLATMHHMVSDGWSIGVLLRELSTLYSAAHAGRPAPLPELAIQYADFAHWQRESLQGQALEHQLAYWRRRLANPSVLRLPTDYLRPATQTFNGDVDSFVLSAALTTSLRALSRREDCTLAALLLAAFQLLLHHYSGQDDILVGVPFANRNRTDIEGIIGLFVNTLVIRADLAGNPTFRALLRQVHQTVLEAYAHQDLPFEKLVDELQPERDLSRSPLFQVVFTFQDAPLQTLAIPGVEVEPFDVHTGTAKFDLTLDIEASATELRCVIEYNTDLFAPATIRRMAAHLRQLLAGIAAAPGRCIGNIPLLSADEQRQMIVGGSERHGENAPESCLHLMFERQARQRPDVVALAFDRDQRSGVRGQGSGRHGDTETEDRRPMIEDRGSTIFHPQSSVLSPQSSVLSPVQLTYADLDRRANQLAHHLRQLGVGPETPVGLCVERSLDLILGILGILKAGGAYVPLDPSYPPERLAFMLEDVQATVLLTQRAIYDLRFTIYDLEESASAIVNRKSKIVNLDADWPEIARCPATPPPDRADAPNLAYIIYTSGSTGRPKGVAVTHANVLRLFQETNRWFQFDHTDIWTLFHSYAFDFSVWEIWGALLYGGRLVMVSYQVSRSPDACYALVCDERVTVLNQTPSAFRQLILLEAQALVELRPMALRYVIFGGEALDPGSLAPWFARHGERQPQLINMYGITETTVHVTYRPITPADAGAAHRSPIGCPISDLRIYLLDRYLNPAPMGVAGEIYVGGAGLARGYLNRPELTAERFVPNPFARGMGDGGWGMEDAPPSPIPARPLRYACPPSPGIRLYRTGDRARVLPNGDLEYLGRIDAQVKIRGFRIELGEIESVLRGHESVREALVLAREDTPGDKRLVAYLVTSDKSQVTRSEDSSLVTRHSPALSGAEGSLVTELRQFLQARLPEYMIPTAFVYLDAFPLTENGKIDRAALPPPDWSRAATEAAYVAPQTGMEELLAAVWARALNLTRVGIHDNFFAIGGDSILSLHVLATARQRGVHFSLQQLFQNPTIAELARAIAAGAAADEQPRTTPFSLIAPEERRRLPTGIEDAYPLAMLQAGMLYHMALAPGSNIYHNTDSYYLRTRIPFNLALFQEAVAAVVARHPVLRTGFDLTGYSEPLQLVHTRATLPTELYDIRHLPGEEQDQVIADLIAREKQRHFDIASPSLLRFFIHLRTDDSFQFTLTECHAIIDGWSLNSTLVEMFQRYFALLNGQVLPQPAPLSVSYRDFVALERLALASPACEQFWTRKLDGATFLPIPRWHVAPAADAGPSQIHMLSLPFAPPLYEGLQQLVKTTAIPLKSILLAAHVKVMSVLGGQNDVLTGVGVNGRPETLDGAQLRGLFINTVPFRLKLASGSWQDLIQATFAAEQELLPFRRYPVAALQQQWGRLPLYEVMFNYVHFHVLHGLTEAVPDLEEIEAIRSEGTNATLVVHFQVHPLTGQLTLDLDYDSTQLYHEQIARIGAYYIDILSAMVADLRQPHHHYAPLSAAEMRQIMEEWNATQTEFRSQESGASRTTSGSWCVHQRFEAQAAHTPDAVAVVFAGHGDTETPRHRDTETEDRRSKIEDRGSTILHPSPPPALRLSSILHPPSSILSPQHLTYDELNRRANRLAWYLRTLGVGPNVLVGLCLERSPDLIIALLATLKAGGAYVPLDPAYPPERLAGMSEELPMAVLITRSGLRDRLPAEAAYVLCLNAIADAVERMADNNPDSGVSPDDLIYVIFTSGSTGRPKGAGVFQRGFANLLDWFTTDFAIAARDSLLLVTSMSFDLTQKNVFAPLMTGGTLHLWEHNYYDPEAIAQLIGARGITLLNCTPSAFYPLVEGVASAGLARLDTLRHVFLGGEPIMAARIRPWLRSAGCRAQIVNTYGPTECTDICGFYRLPDAAYASSAPAPLGRPIANVQMFVLGPRLEPLPIGVTGELCVAGAGVGYGYIGDPALTAAKFVPNPFAEGVGDKRSAGGGLGGGMEETRRQGDKETRPAPSGNEGRQGDDESATQNLKRPEGTRTQNLRLYRTGDLARYRPDGMIEFLGRHDHQIKLRGFRIELGEIELAVAAHPAVRECVALLREDRPGEQRLVAYIVQGSGVRGQGSETAALDGLIPDPGSLTPELRGFLKQHLPDYMVPAAFVLLDALPLTPNGKIDRSALPAPPHAGSALDADMASPRNELERAIADVWKDVLQIDRVGIATNFFDLGGHSLLIVRMHGMLRQQLGRDLPITDVLQYPTIQALAAHLSQNADRPSERSQRRIDARREARSEVAQRGQSRGKRQAATPPAGEGDERDS